MKTNQIINKIKNGFTLIELMIVIAIIAILAAIAIPAYQSYTAKSKFAEITTAVSSLKTDVVNCYNNSGNVLTSCDSGTGGMPAAVTATVGKLAGLSVTNGVIVGTAISGGGLSGEILSATPTPTTAGQGSVLTWQYTGTAVTQGFVSN